MATNIAIHAHGSVRTVTGLALLTAAALKAYPLMFLTLPEQGWIDVVLVLYELSLGLWLISGGYAHASVRIAAATFGLFAAYSVEQALSGSATCGCFGLLNVNPWLTSVIDALFFGLLVAIRPRKEAGIPAQSHYRVAAAAGLALALAVPFGITVRSNFQTAARLPASTSEPNSQLPVSHPQSERLVYDFGYVRPGSTQHGTFRVRSPTREVLKIARVELECDCIELSREVTRLPGDSALELPFAFDAPDRQTRYHKRVVLVPADKRTDPIVLDVRARVGLPLIAKISGLDHAPVAPEQARQIDVTVFNGGEKPVRLLYSTSRPSGWVARVPREPVPPEGRLTIPVIAKPADYRPGRHTTHLNIHTDSEEQPLLAVPIRFTVEAPE